LGFELVPSSVRLKGKEIETLSVEWTGESSLTAADLDGIERGKGRDRSQGAKAAQFLIEFLGDGPKPKKMVIEAGKRRGLSKPTLERSAKKLGVQKGKVWSLPGWDRCEETSKES
jgi:hypothetical protein